jgi:uncharacterized membrane protein YedE/YeeE
MSEPVVLEHGSTTDWGWIRNRGAVWTALGLLALLAATVGGQYGWRQGLLVVVGGLLGVALYHASFGFTSAWRVFVFERRGAGVQAQLVMLALAVTIFFPILAAGEIFGQPVRGFVSPVGWSVVVGAFVFGIGMQLGGGCASGTLFAVGGGNTRMVLTLAAGLGRRRPGAAERGHAAAGRSALGDHGRLFVLGRACGQCVGIRLERLRLLGRIRFSTQFAERHHVDDERCDDPGGHGVCRIGREVSAGLASDLAWSADRHLGRPADGLRWASRFWL